MVGVTLKIETGANLLASFTIQDVLSGEKSYRSNVQSAGFELVEGHKYAAVAEVVGENGSKYKFKVSGVAKASYPKGEQIINGNRDLLLARITA